AAFDNKHARIKRRIIDSPPKHTPTHTPTKRARECIIMWSDPTANLREPDK
ncbi:hypothetical protein KUCAC02_001067, partial [Chaenocephalus aceratus]